MIVGLRRGLEALDRPQGLVHRRPRIGPEAPLVAVVRGTIEQLLSLPDGSGPRAVPRLRPPDKSD